MSAVGSPSSSNISNQVFGERNNLTDSSYGNPVNSAWEDLTPMEQRNCTMDSTAGLPRLQLSASSTSTEFENILPSPDSSTSAQPTFTPAPTQPTTAEERDTDSLSDISNIDLNDSDESVGVMPAESPSAQLRLVREQHLNIIGNIESRHRHHVMNLKEEHKRKIAELEEKLQAKHNEEIRRLKFMHSDETRKLRDRLKTAKIVQSDRQTVQRLRTELSLTRDLLECATVHRDAVQVIFEDKKRVIAWKNETIKRLTDHITEKDREIRNLYSVTDIVNWNRTDALLDQQVNGCPSCAEMKEQHDNIAGELRLQHDTMAEFRKQHNIVVETLALAQECLHDAHYELQRLQPLQAKVQAMSATPEELGCALEGMLEKIQFLQDHYALNQRNEEKRAAEIEQLKSDKVAITSHIIFLRTQLEAKDDEVKELYKDRDDLLCQRGLLEDKCLNEETARTFVEQRVVELEHKADKLEEEIALRKEVKVAQEAYVERLWAELDDANGACEQATQEVQRLKIMIRETTRQEESTVTMAEYQRSLQRLEDMNRETYKTARMQYAQQ